MSETSPERSKAGERDVLLAMEPELRTHRGVLAAMRIFAQSPDPVDPAAIAVLATSGSDAATRVLDLWREALGERPP